MFSHRELKPEDYVDVLKRRGWIIALFAVLIPLITVGVTFFIAPRFISQTLVLIDQQKVPDDYVKPVLSADLDNRLASMKEQILSRSRIQPIVERMNLYSGHPMEDRIDMMRKSIAIKPIHSEIDRSNGLPGFFITYTATDPRVAQLVCGEITSLFVNENLRDRQQAAQGTTSFLKSQLEEAKRNLDEQDARVAEFQQKYVGKLPGEDAPNLNMLTSLNTQLEAATQSLSRMEQDKTYAESMLAQQSRELPSSDLHTVSALTQQDDLQKLLSQESDLSARYTADYPDLVAVRRKIKDLRTQIEKSAAAPRTAPPATPTHAEPLGMQQLRAQVRAAGQGITAKRAEQSNIQQAIRVYQDRIQSSPLVAEQYKDLTRDYETAQKFYDELLAKMNQSKMATDLEQRQQGEQFRVMDEPNLPDSPSFPKRSYFAGGGLALGLLIGFLLVAFLEYKNQTIRSEQDIQQILRLPMYAAISTSDIAPAQETSPTGIRRLFGLKAKEKSNDSLSKAGS